MTLNCLKKYYIKMYLSLDIKGIKVTRGIKMDKMNVEIQKYTWKYLIVLFFQIPLLWRAIYLRDKITQQKKKKKKKKLSKSLFVLKFHFSWFFIRQKCSSWQKLIIGVVFRTTSAFLATFYACTATRHFIQLWGERVKVGRLIKARVFELGIARLL